MSAQVQDQVYGLSGVFCNSGDDLHERACHARKLDYEDIVMIKVGIDGGKGSLNAGMSILTEADIAYLSDSTAFW